MAVDNLLAENVQSQSSVTTPTIGQVHVILAEDVESASEAPVAQYVHVILADDIESASEVGAPVLGHNYVFIVTQISSASEAGSPSPGQVHGLLADDIKSLSQNLFIQDLLANDIESAASVQSISLTYKYRLRADDATVATVTLYQTEETA